MNYPDEKCREKYCKIKQQLPFSNAPAHKISLAIAELRVLKYKLLEHQQYLPDLLHSNFHLLPNGLDQMKG